MIHRFGVCIAMGALAASMAACASNSVPIRARGPSGGVQGNAWELVVPGPLIVAALEDTSPAQRDAILTRRDYDLGASTPSWAPVAASGPATTIASQQAIHLRRSHDSFLFFTAPRPHWPPQRQRWLDPYAPPAEPHTPRYWSP